jgi:hypothetical protein
VEGRAENNIKASNKYYIGSRGFLTTKYIAKQKK